MKKNVFRKSLIIGTIILFLGAYVMPTFFSNVKADLNEGLVGYWKFDEGSGNIAHDSSGNGNYGTIYGATLASGIDGSALDIIDTDIIGDIPSSFDDSITTCFTITGWVYWHGEHPETYSQRSTIFDARTMTSGFIFSLTVDATVQLNCRYGSERQSCISLGTVPIDQWTHVGAVFDYTSQTISVFINGEKDNTITAVSPYYSTSLTAAIGNNRWAPGDSQWAPFNGIIDELRIYNRALSEGEIYDLWEEYGVENQPSVANAGGPYDNDEGSLIVFDSSNSLDPDGDELQYRWDFNNDGTWDTDYSNDPTATLTWFDDYTGTVAVEVFDGMFTDSDNATVNVLNVPPVADAGEDKMGVEPSPFTFTGSHTDPGTEDTHTYEWDFDYDGTTFDVDATGNDVSNTWCDDFDGIVALRVTDDDDGWSIDILSVVVSNVAPNITALTVTPSLVEVNDTVTLDANFTDPGCDTWAAYIDWENDGIYDDTMLLVTSPIQKTHSYADTGVYTVKLKVEDDDDGYDTEIFQYVVVYDPNDGFVTGGGWIDSPEGAYTPDPNLTGKATFGFVSKYQKGQQKPTGNTEFQFHAAGMNFHSDEYDWLVVAGAKAMYKGNGTINGAGNYGFMISAIDEELTNAYDVDMFRIKIWDKDNGDAIIYDNNMGNDPYGDPTTAIAGGQIVIHKT